LILAEQEPQAETTKARDKEVQENLLKRESRPAKIHEERVGETGSLSKIGSVSLCWTGHRDHREKWIDEAMGNAMQKVKVKEASKKDRIMYIVFANDG
jgi:hypothetical protein